MAIERVGIYRSYYGPKPKDRSGKPLPKGRWPAKRAHSWVVRWHGSHGERYSRSCRTRKEAERVAESIRTDVHKGKADKPEKMTLQEFAGMYMSIRTGGHYTLGLILLGKGDAAAALKSFEHPQANEFDVLYGRILVKLVGGNAAGADVEIREFMHYSLIT